MNGYVKPEENMPKNIPETKIEIKSNNVITLEGLLHIGTSDHGVVITHPHPLYGGDMYNIVVETIQRAYQEKGYTTLRFNFQGVGRSSGQYDDGNGEQENVLSSIRALKERGVQSIGLAGYSFGSWVIAKALDNDKIDNDTIAADSVIMVSPPAAMMPFESKSSIAGLKLVITGSHDEFAPPDVVKELVAIWNSSAAFKVIDGADHFFSGYTDKLTSVLTDHI